MPGNGDLHHRVPIRVPGPRLALILGTMHLTELVTSSVNNDIAIPPFYHQLIVTLSLYPPSS
jgi:hypothetical protein